MKDFLKEHYDKILLLGLFCVFIGLMFTVQGIISSTKEITEESLQIPKRKADHKKADPDSEYLNVSVQKSKGALKWDDNHSRNTEIEAKAFNGFSDLTFVFPIAKCPYCKGEKAIYIPLDNFSSKDQRRNCLICGTYLPTPPERRKAKVLTASENDSDGDGISNDDERKYGLDPNNPDDALADNDNDGFSNVFEIANNSDPRNGRIHPPHWWRLVLADVAQIELPIKFMKLNDNNSDDKTKWELQFNVKRKKREQTQFYALNEVVSIDRRDYKIVEIVRDIKVVKAAGENGKETVEDKSKIFLVEELYGETNRQPDKLVMFAGQPAYSSDKRPILKDVGFYPPLEHALTIGGEVRVGAVNNENRGGKRYQVAKVDVEKMIVWIVDRNERADENGNRTLIEITKDGKIPQEMRVGEKKKDASETEGDETF